VIGSERPPTTSDRVLGREREFHDALATGVDASRLAPREPDQLEQSLLARAGEIAGAEVLELGCGTGDLTLQLLARGANLTALDLSDGMIGIARERVHRFSRARASFVAAPVERCGLTSESFDLVIGKWILHHADIGGAAREIGRVLRPGGRAVFLENSGLNPLLAFARNHLTGRWGIPRYGTKDEHPLTRTDYEIFRHEFKRFSMEFPDFFVFQLFDRQVLKFRYPIAGRAMRGLDNAIGHISPLRRFSYHVLLEMSG
jgi:ubiquinone/menaquinone biosynthesis C-methylase UbiE